MHPATAQYTKRNNTEMKKIEIIMSFFYKLLFQEGWGVTLFKFLTGISRSISGYSPCFSFTRCTPHDNILLVVF